MFKTEPILITETSRLRDSKPSSFILARCNLQILETDGSQILAAFYLNVPQEVMFPSSSARIMLLRANPIASAFRLLVAKSPGVR